MSWDEAFSRRYDQWSAHMTEDIAFYVALFGAVACYALDHNTAVGYC